MIGWGQRHGPALVVSAVTALALVLFLRVAAALPYWYDELLTIRIAEVESLGTLWRALTAGFDFNPPLNYLLTRVTSQIALPGLAAPRLPALAGFLLLITGLFAGLRARTSGWVAASVVCMVPLVPHVIGDTTEARPYMLVLGVAAWAIRFWQRLVDERGAHLVSLLGMSIAVSAALLLHMWALLLPCAILVAEGAHLLRTRTVRTRVFVGLALSAPAALVYGPIVAAARGITLANEVYAPSLDKLITGFSQAVPRLRALLLAGATAAAAGWWTRHHTPPPAPKSMSPEDRWLAIALVASPMVPFAYATVSDNVFMPRYAAISLIGGCYLAADLIQRLTAGRTAAAALTAIVAALTTSLFLPARLVPPATSVPLIVRTLEQADQTMVADVPVILINPTDVLPFDEAASAAWKQRAVFVADGDLAARYTGTNAIDLGYIRGAPYLGMSVRRLSLEELDSWPRVYLAGRWQALSWVPLYLQERGWAFSPVAGPPTAPIHLAVRPATSLR